MLPGNIHIYYMPHCLIIYHSSDSLAEDITGMIRSQNDLPSIFKGFLTIRHDPSYYLYEPEGERFLSRFRKLPPTKFIDSQTGKISCPVVFDDANETELYATYFFGKRKCIGIASFSNFTASNIDPITLYVYDSVYTIVNAVDSFINQYGFNNLNRSSFHDFLTSINYPTDKTGYVSGNISFSPGDSSADYFAQGDRYSGHVYSLLNFNDAVYFKRSQLASDDRNNAIYTSNPAFVHVGSWSQNTGVLLCGKDVLLMHRQSQRNCQHGAAPIYRSGVYPPNDEPPPIIEHFSSSTTSTLMALSIICLVFTLCCCFATFIFRNNKHIKKAQPSLLFSILFGYLLVGILLLVDTFEITNASCDASLWLSHTGFRIVFGSYAMKLWRIDKILNTKGIKKVKITDYDVFETLGILTLLVLVVIAIIQGAYY